MEVVETEETSSQSEKQEVEKESNFLKNFFEQTCQDYVKLVQVKKKLKERADVEEYFRKKNLDKSLKTLQNLSSKVVNELDEQTKIISDSRIRDFADICCLNGGTSHAISRLKSGCKGVALVVPSFKETGGFPKNSKRLRCFEADISQSVPTSGHPFDLIVLNGWTWENPEIPIFSSPSPVKIKSFVVGQLMYALQNLIPGGNLLMKLSHKESLFYASIIQILMDSFERIQLTKPGTHCERSLFYVVGFGYKNTKTTYQPLLESAYHKLKTGVDVLCLLDLTNLKNTYSAQLAQHFLPLWKAQLDALQTTFGLTSSVPEAPVPAPPPPPPVSAKSLKEEEDDFSFSIFNYQAPKSPQPSSTSSSVPSSPQSYSSMSLSSPSTSHGSSPVDSNLKKFSFKYESMESRGIIYHCTKGNFRSSDPLLSVTSSTISVGTPIDFINPEQVRCWTQNIPYSWFCVDLGPNRKAIPNHYKLGYASPGSACCPRNWLLQGSNELTQSDPQYGLQGEDTPDKDPDWVTLAVHSNDNRMSLAWAFHSWKIYSTEGFRYFRVIQTGPNSFAASKDDSWSQVLVAGRFEIFGDLYETKSSQGVPTLQPGKTKSITYGPSSGVASSTVAPAPPIIRANPAVTRELQEYILLLAKPQNESRTHHDRVRVHEITL